MGRNVVSNLEKRLRRPPMASPVVLTDGTAVCNCPRGGNEAMQIEIADLRLWYCPTRSGVLRIEDWMAVPGRRKLVPTSFVELRLGHTPQPT